VEATTDD